MASFLELIDNTLGTHFNAPVYDPVKGRKKLLTVIDGAAKQHTGGATKAPNRAWRAGTNDAISFAPRLNGNPVVIGGEEINYVPAERFQDFLGHLRTAVNAGELDKEIKAALEGDGTVTGGGKSTSSRSTGGAGLGSVARPDDAQWMERFTAKHGPAPSADHVPNSKGTRWATRAAVERGRKSKGL